jgi:hypothetical protein
MSKSLETEEVSDSDNDNVTNSANITSMTICVKAVLLFVMFFRFAVTVLLLWLGCRWLLATNRFSDLILNAVALEFVLQLKETIFATLVSTRSKADLQITTIKPGTTKMPPDLWNFINTMGLLIIAIAWVLLYMIVIQDVLPSYQWDIQHTCNHWIQSRYCVGGHCITQGDNTGGAARHS